MALVENINRRGADAGRFTPHADQNEYCSSWGVVEGNASSGWIGVNEHTDGIARGQGREKLLRFKEYRDNEGKPHEIHFGNMKLREMICRREDADEATRFEGMQSNSRVTMEEQVRQNEELGLGLSANRHISTDYFECVPTEQPDFLPPQPKRGGRPKGSKNKPKISVE